MKVVEVAIQPSDIAKIIPMNTKIALFLDGGICTLFDANKFINECVKGNYDCYEVTEISVGNFNGCDCLSLRFDMME